MIIRKASHMLGTKNLLRHVSLLSGLNKVVIIGADRFVLLPFLRRRALSISCEHEIAFYIGKMWAANYPLNFIHRSIERTHRVTHPYFLQLQKCFVFVKLLYLSLTPAHFWVIHNTVSITVEIPSSANGAAVHTLPIFMFFIWVKIYTLVSMQGFGPFVLILTFT